MTGTPSANNKHILRSRVSHYSDWLPPLCLPRLVLALGIISSTLQMSIERLSTQTTDPRFKHGFLWFHTNLLSCSFLGNEIGTRLFFSPLVFEPTWLVLTQGPYLLKPYLARASRAIPGNVQGTMGDRDQAENQISVSSREGMHSIS